MSKSKTTPDKKIKYKKILVIFAGLAGVILIVSVAWAGYYLHKPIKLKYKLDNVKVEGPIAVDFSQPIQRQVKYAISPAIPGEWKRSTNLLGITSLNFYPAKPLTPGSKFQLQLVNVSAIIDTRPSITEQTIPIIVEPPANIARVIPANNATNVKVNSTISLKLSSPNKKLRKLKLNTDLALVSDEPTSSDDTTFIWTPAKPLQQGATYHASFIDANQPDSDKQTLQTTTFTAVAEPHVTAATNRGYFYPGEKITIKFDQDMQPTDKNFEFGFSGNGLWKDARTYIYTPTNLSAGNSYTYTVKKGTSSVQDGVTETDHTYKISPPGAVVVTGLSPSGGNVAVNSSISVGFDQPVDHASAQSAFSISPAVGGNFSWNGNTMVYSHAGLGYQAGYSISIAPGIKSVHGLPSSRGWSQSFTTTYKVTKLAVPYYKQAYALSCEESSLRMALAYRGVYVSDYDVLLRVGYNPVPRDIANNFWDNPYNMFVGDVTGQMGVTGWGTYGNRIASAAQSFGRNASYINGVSANQIAQAIIDNNPVVLWGHTGSVFKPDSWNTSSGVVQAPRNEHVRTVFGVAGNASNPVGFYIHDPIYGDLYWTTAQLQWNMSFQGALPSQAVIVY